MARTARSRTCCWSSALPRWVNPARGRCAAGIRRAWPGARFAAPAFPVRCTPGDNLAIHVAVTKAPEGSALVVDVGDLRDSATGVRCSPPRREARGLRAW